MHQLKEDFLHHEDHTAALVNALSPEDAGCYRACLNSRLETCYRGRSFIVYRVPALETRRETIITTNKPLVFDISDETPEVLDKLVVTDLYADDVEGISVNVKSREYGDLLVGYSPHRLGDFSLFLFVPLHTKLRWSAPASDLSKGSLGFPLVIRTQSHLHMREVNVVHCETGVAFRQQFPELQV